MLWTVLGIISDLFVILSHRWYACCHWSMLWTVFYCTTVFLSALLELFSLLQNERLIDLVSLVRTVVKKSSILPSIYDYNPQALCFGDKLKGKTRSLNFAVRNFR